MMAHYRGFHSTAQVNLGELLDDLLALVLQHGVQMQPAFAAIAKSLVVAEGLCLQLAPDFDSQSIVREEGRAILMDRLAPKRILDDLLRIARTAQRYAQMLPRQSSQVLARLQSGGLKLRVSHENLERPLHRLDLMVNRIVFALVVSAIIGSSTNIIAGGSVSGSLGQVLTYGYLIAGVLLGGWLLFSILRSGRL
jgi:ubiquinone biosynthesis protein